MNIPNEWRFCPLSELIGEFAAGVSVNSEDRRAVNGECGVLKTSCVTAGYFNSDEHKVIAQNEIGRAKVKPVADRIIISRMNTPALVGASAYIEKDYGNLYLPDRLWLLGPKDKDSCVMRWLAYVLSSSLFRKRIGDLASGTSGSMKNISKAKLLTLHIPTPPLPEQKKIAEILSCWDRGIEFAERHHGKLFSFKLFLLHKLIYKNQVHPERGWKLISVCDLFDILDNLREPLNSSERLEVQGDIPYYGANGCVGYVDKYIFNEPLILVAEDGGYFDEFQTRPIAYRVDGKSWVNNHAHVLRAKKEFSQDFLFYSFVHKNIIPYLSGGTRAKLNKSALEEIEIPVPVDVNKQNEIAIALNSLERSLELVDCFKSHLKKQKQGLMQKLLTGKVRVNA